MRERTVDHLVGHGDQQPAQQFGVHLQLHRHWMVVDAAEDIGDTGTLGVGELGRGADLRDDFAPARHRDLRQKLRGLVRRFAAQQLDGLDQQRQRDRIDPAAGALKHLAQQLNPPFGGGAVVAQQDGKPWLRVEDAGEPEQLLFDLIDPILAFGDDPYVG